MTKLTHDRSTVEKHESFSQDNLEKSEIARVMSCLQRELNEFSINKSNDELQKQVWFGVHLLNLVLLDN